MLAPWKKIYDQSRQHIKKQRHYFANKSRLVKAMVFSVVMYRCESWTINKSGQGRINAFELWCWRRLLRVPWTARRSNQSTLKEIIPGCFLEGMMPKLKLQYFGHLKNWLIGKDPDAGKGWRQEEKGTTEDEIVGWHHSLNERGFAWTPGVGDGQGGLACWFMGSQRVRHDWATEQQPTIIVLPPSPQVYNSFFYFLLPRIGRL